VNIEEIQPVPVHVVRDTTKDTGPARPCRVVMIPRTIVLTSSAPVRNVLGTDPDRRYVLAQAIGNDVVLAATEAMAQDAYNEQTGLPNPDGHVLAHANTGPSRLETTEALWAATATYPATVTLAIFTTAEGA
jgi:hypothetical protein